MFGMVRKIKGITGELKNADSLWDVLLNENETVFSTVLSENEDYNKQLGMDTLDSLRLELQLRNDIRDLLDKVLS